MDRDAALILLRTALNDPAAQFRPHQWEAIDQLINKNQKLLVIERTGWGKSSVYFISTRILRNKGKGPTIIISPLLALMRNQIEAAERLGIKAVTMNSTNTEDWAIIKEDVLNNKIDVLLISPERLANDDFVESVLRPIADRIGLFVVDEAHCISDWGHDFRPDYRRIANILKFMPQGMPVLGTTATANNRVINDIVSQLGGLQIIRGSLMRESLRLQNIKLSDQTERLAWLKENVPLLPGIHTPPAWACIRYHKQISNKLDQHVKEEKFREFLKESRYEFNNSKPEGFSYLELCGNNDDRDGYTAAVARVRNSGSRQEVV